jgi:hypothetical protein
MLATPALIVRSMTNNWARVSGKGNGVIQRWRPNKKRKRTSITTVRDQYGIYHLPPSRPPLFSHWSLPLKLRSISKLKAKIFGIGLETTIVSNTLVEMFP